MPTESVQWKIPCASAGRILLILAGIILQGCHFVCSSRTGPCTLPGCSCPAELEAGTSQQPSGSVPECTRSVDPLSRGLAPNTQTSGCDHELPTCKSWALGESTLGTSQSQWKDAIVFINEFHYDNNGKDVNEAVEVFGPAGTVLDGYILTLYNGANSKQYKTFILAGTIQAVPPADYGVLVTLTKDLQNGSPDGLSLSRPDGMLIMFLCYKGTFSAADGPAQGVLCEDVGVAEGSGDAIGQSLQLVNRAAGGCTYGDFTWTGPGVSSFGGLNAGQTASGDCQAGPQHSPTPPSPIPPPPAPVPFCGGPYTKTYEIQGSGASSPLQGQMVITGGVVTANWNSSCGVGGYVIQDAVGDGDASTSDGLYVFDRVNVVEVGDFVLVQGRVQEYQKLTELTAVQALVVCGKGSPLPAAVAIPVLAKLSDQEASYRQLESMLVTFPTDLAITDNYNLARYGEVVLNQNETTGAERSWTPTQVFQAGVDSVAYRAAQRQLTVDDAKSCQNLDPVNFPGFSYNSSVRVGTTVTGGWGGVLTYQFSEWRVQPASGGSIGFELLDTNPRLPPPIASGKGKCHAGRPCIKSVVAFFNVLNYFNGRCDNSSPPVCTFCNSCSESPAGRNRGANSAAEFLRQRTKIISAITAMDADIVGLSEVENDGYGNTSAIADLVRGLNEAQNDTIDYYAAVTKINNAALDSNGLPTAVGQDAIVAAMIYRPSRYYPLGPTFFINSSVDRAFYSQQRPTELQRFISTADGGEFALVLNHLKSKGSACPGDPDLGLGAGNCDQTRMRSVQAITRWLDTKPSRYLGGSYLVLGDMNSYADEDPIRVFEAAGYMNMLSKAFGSTGPYSYVFGAASGYLDHCLATEQMAAQISAVAEWHINADESAALDYNFEFKTPAQVEAYYGPGPYRSSDHDPVMVGLNLVANVLNLFDVLLDIVGANGPPGAPNKLASTLTSSLQRYKSCNSGAAVQLLTSFQTGMLKCRCLEDGRVKVALQVVLNLKALLRSGEYDSPGCMAQPTR